MFRDNTLEGRGKEGYEERFESIGLMVDLREMILSVGWVNMTTGKKNTGETGMSQGEGWVTHSKILEVGMPFQILQYRLNERLNVLF